MEKKNLFERILEKILAWIRSLLRQLFPADVLDRMGLSESSGEEGARAAKNQANEPDEEELKRMKETPVERRHILFFGRVQGVGFRYHAMYGARNFGLTGWVANRMDGSVEMEVQGPSGQIDYLIHNLGNGNWIRIEAMDSEKIPVVEGERGFQVRGY